MIVPSLMGVIARGSSSWDPNSIPDLEVDLQADSIGDSDNDPVSVWGDNSPNGNDATFGTDAVFKPTGFYGLPTVRFQGTAYATLDAAVCANSDATVFIVGEHLPIDDVNQYLLGSQNIGSDQGDFIGWDGTTTSCRIGRTTVSTQTAGYSGGKTWNQILCKRHVICIKFSGTTATVYVDGVSQGSLTVGTGANGWNLIGATRSNAGVIYRFLKADISAIIIYSKALSDVERAYMDDGLVAKWITPGTDYTIPQQANATLWIDAEQHVLESNPRYIRDTSGNGRHGDGQGSHNVSVTATSVINAARRAFVFNNVPWLALVSSGIDDDTTFTLSFMIEYTDVSADSYVFGATNSSMILGWEPPGGTFCRFPANGGGGYFAAGPTSSQMLDATKRFSFVVTGGVATMYVDGVSVTSRTFVPTGAWVLNEIGSFQGGQRKLRAQIAAAVFHNVALSGAEVLELHDNWDARYL